MRTTRVPARSVSSDAIAKALEANGWSKEVAGDQDFDNAVAAIGEMLRTGRGLFITGDAGCGKTQLMRALQKILNPKTLNWVYCKEPEDLKYLRSRDDELLNTTVYIDDIGCEEIVREYGNIIDIIGDFIQLYHYRGKGRMMGTTNLNSQAINEKYGMRMLDRVLEMCVVLKLNGKSKRKRIVYGN